LKKIISIAVAFVIIATMFVGCVSTSAAKKDGTYRAEFSAADDHGWTEYVEITVAGDKITNVVYDSLNDGKKKSEDKDYEKTMKNVSGGKTWPADFYSKLTAQLLEKQNIDEVDTVAGATTSSDDFKTLVKSLSKNMQNGKTETVKVEK